MGYTVSIKNNDTNEIRDCFIDVPWDESSLYWWTEGNMSCDCNRSIIFNDWIDMNFECGEEQYSVLAAKLEDGTIIPIES